MSNNKTMEHEKRLRLNAEGRVQASVTESPQNIENLSPQDSAKMVHELWVHQIELEMQKEELFKTQTELEISRSRYFDLYNLAPVGYLTLQENGLIIESNLTASTLLGIPRQKLENSLIYKHILSDDRDTFYHHCRKLFSTGQSQSCQLRLNRFNPEAAETFFWARIESSVVANDSEKIESDNVCSRMIRVVMSDISNYLKITAQLHQAKKMETVGLLAGGIAHDYNNKLAVIIGYAELALNQEVSSETMSVFIAEILKAAQLSATITRQLLTFARRQIIVPVVLDINQVVESSLIMLRQILGSEINLVWKSERNLDRAKMDPVQIDQILVNLCLNARDAIADVGKVTVETKNAVFDSAFCLENAGYLEGEFVVLVFSDTGHGMSKDILDKILEPFFTTKEVGKGTGLGLASVDGIVQQNNGFMKIISEPGTGTTFQIYFPRYLGSSDSWVSEKNVSDSPGNGATVLLVEDELALLSMIQIMLEKLGFRVLAASSSAEALMLANEGEKSIDLLLTDVIMPEMNGSDMAARLKPVFPDMKNLFMSGYPANVLAKRGVIASGINFIQKPFSIKELAKKIIEVTNSTTFIEPGCCQQ